MVMTAIGPLLPPFPNKSTDAIGDSSWVDCSCLVNCEEIGGEKEEFSLAQLLPLSIFFEQSIFETSQVSKMSTAPCTPRDGKIRLMCHLPV